jgi:predicted nucleotidyltransferase
MRKSATLRSLFPSVRQGVLDATLRRPEKWWYLSELADFLGTRPSSLQRELVALVDIGILEKRRDGNRAYFKAQKASPIFRELQSIFEKTAGVSVALTKVLQPFKKKIVCSFIYGSLARAEEHAHSDVDLMVIGRIGLAELAPSLRTAENHLGREVNVTNYSVREFHDKVRRGDHFLSTVLKKPKQFILGDESELEAITRG